MPRFVPRYWRRLRRYALRATAVLSTVDGGRVAAQDLARGGRIARPQGVHLAQARGSKPSALRDSLHVHLGRKQRLRRAEPAECAVGRRVRHDDPAVDAHVIAPVRTGGVQASPRQDDGAERAVGAAVHQHVDVHCREAAVAGHAGPVAHDGRVALGRREHVLAAVVDEFHRPSDFSASRHACPAIIDGYSSLPRTRRRFPLHHADLGVRHASSTRAHDARSRGTAANRSP